MQIIYCFLLWLFSTYAFALPTVEVQMRDYLQKTKTEQEALLKKLVNINSGTTNIAGVKKVGNELIPQFKKLGFTTTWVNEPATMKRAPTLVAEHKGLGKAILLIGHLDTVFPKNSKFKHYRVKKNIARGPGTADDKGGLVVILYSLKALQAAKVLKNKNIIVVLTGDEEDSGKPTSISRQPLFAAAKKSAIALDFESAVTLDTITIARRGIAHWTISSTGSGGHSGGIFGENTGYGAAFEMSRILHTMYKELYPEKDLTFNPGILLAGTKIEYDKQDAQGKVFGKENIIAKTALAKGDFRFISNEQKQHFIDKLTEIVKKSLRDTASKVSFQDGIPAMQPTEANKALLEEYNKVSKALNLGEIKALPAGLRGAGDISHIAAIVPASLAGLGPLGSEAHGVGEQVNLPSLQTQSLRAATLIYRYKIS